MTRYEEAGELASRDLVARAIVREQARAGGPVYLSMQHLDPAWVRARFPTITAVCATAGLDLATDRIPVGPAAHYVMGGVQTDLWGKTTVPGLYAAGEVACTGVHGANRLASNSLLEGLVFGARAAQAMLEPVRTRPLEPLEPLEQPRLAASAGSRRSRLDVELGWVLAGGGLLRTAIEALDEWYAALGGDRSRIAALVTVGPLDGAGRLAPRRIARLPCARRLSCQR